MNEKIKSDALLVSPDGNELFRVIYTKENRVFAVDCKKRRMPAYFDTEFFQEYETYPSQNLLCDITPVDRLSEKRRQQAMRRFGLITGALSVLDDTEARATVIAAVAKTNGVSKQTIRSYLCKYLVYGDVGALADKERDERELTQEEKIMRWALNKFFYTQHKNSLPTAYAMMLKEKYTNADGSLKEHPTIYQFRYFYKKHRKMEHFFISRNGLKDYQMNNRPLLGDGVQQLAPSIGVAFLDSTVCDIYLVNEAGLLVGRPVLTAAVDVNTSLCLGYSLSWEGGIYSVGRLLCSILEDKTELCRRSGILIDRDSWPNRGVLPGQMITDRGREYLGAVFEQITELGVTLVNLPAFRAELKGSVERFFGLVQDSYKTVLKGKGVIMPDFQKRGAHDYRKDAVLTLEDFEKIVLRCIVYYNSERVLEKYPYTEEMLREKVRPYAADVWKYKLSQYGANLIPISENKLKMTLLPRTTGTFTRAGLKVNKMRYHAEGYTEEYLTGGKASVAYNPDDAGHVWLKEEDGRFVKFDLIETRFSGMSVEDANGVIKRQASVVKDCTEENYRAQVDLMRFIEAIAAGKTKSNGTSIKNVRETRASEQRRNHKNMGE